MRGSNLRPQNPSDRLIVTEDFDWAQVSQHRKLREVYDIVHAVKLGASFLRYPAHRRVLAGLRARGITTFLDIVYASSKEQQIRYNLERDSISQYTYVTVASNMGSRLIERHVEIGSKLPNGPGIIAALGRRNHRNGTDDEIENLREAQDNLASKGLRVAGIIFDSDQMDRTHVLGNDVVGIVESVRLPGAPKSEHEFTVTPAEAIRMGADRIAVGEPITTAEDPLAVAEAYIADMS